MLVLLDISTLRPDSGIVEIFIRVSVRQGFLRYAQSRSTDNKNSN
jgi:hypothetical protein